MRLAAWVWCAISVALLAAAGPVRAAAPPQALTQAGYAVGPAQAPWHGAPPVLDAPPAADWTLVTLPHHTRQQTYEGQPVRTLRQTDWHWYRLTVPAAQLAGPTPALYIPRLHLGGTLVIYLDGQRQAAGEGGDVVHFNRPILVGLRPAAARSGDAELLLRLESPAGTLHALAAPWVGDNDLLRVRMQGREWLQVEGPRVASACLLLLGLFALLVGLRRRHEPQHLWFFALAALFFLRCLHYHSHMPWADVSPEGQWFTWLTVNSLAWITGVAVRMARALHGLRHPRAEAVVWALALAVTLLTLPWIGQAWPQLALGPLIYPVHMLQALLAVGLLAHAARRSGSGHTAALAAVLALNLLLGVHDFALRLALIPVDGVYLLPYGGLAMFGVVLHAMARGYSRALTQAEQAAVVLDRKLAEREAELRHSHEQLRRIEREQVLVDERQRLMRDMHDGLGATLASSLVAVQRGRLPPDAVAQVLRESVDELRLTLDALDPAGSDPLLLLANLRYRLAPRLEAAGITLDWQLQDLPELPGLGPGAVQHLLRMLQEALANVVKHAQATRVTVSAERAEGRLCLLVADDGRGFDPTTAAQGRGLGNLRRRAEQLGGQVHYLPCARGSTLRIVLPMGT